MKDSQLKNKAQIQQIERLRVTVEELEDKISEIKELVDSKKKDDVLNKIQQIECSKQSLEDLKKMYQKDIDKLKKMIDDLREKIGK